MRRRKINPLQPLQPRGNIGGRYFIHGFYNGRSYTRGGYQSESEARAGATSMFQGVDATWNVELLPTTSLQRAKQIFRDRDLSNGMNIDQAMRPHYGNVKFKRLS